MADAGATSISGSYRQAQTIKSFGAENSSISTGAGDDKLRIEAISRKSNFNVWSDRRNGNQDAGRWDSGWRSEERVALIDESDNGQSIGVKNSTIDTGTGNDDVEIRAKGFSTSLGGLDWSGARHITGAESTFNQAWP